MFGKKGKILKLPRFAIILHLQWHIINSLKVPKIKKILLYEMKFLVPNYSCLHNPWLGATAPRSLFSLSTTKFVEPPPPKQNSWVCHCSEVLIFYKWTLISLIQASSKIRVCYNWSVTKKWNLFHSLMHRPNTKFHKNTVSNLGQETSNSNKGLNMTQDSFYETLWGAFNQTVERYDVSFEDDIHASLKIWLSLFCNFPLMRNMAAKFMQLPLCYGSVWFFTQLTSLSRSVYDLSVSI